MKVESAKKTLYFINIDYKWINTKVEKAKTHSLPF